MSTPARPTNRLAFNTLVYGAGIVISRAAAFIMLPVYTRMLTPADYGLLQILDMTVEVAIILVSAGITIGVLRFYFKATSETERNQVLASALVFQTILNAVGSLLIVAAARPIHLHALDGAGTISMVYLAAANLTVGLLMTVPLLKMQAEGRSGLYMAASVTKLLIQLTLNIVFLVGLKTGPVGILWSTFLSNAVIGSIAVWWMLRSTGFAVDRSAIRDLRRFGIPYQIMIAGTFLLAFGDRFILQSLSGLTAVGIYSLAYQFGFLLVNLGATPFFRAWNPIRFQIATNPQTERDATYARGFRQLDLIHVTLGIGIAVYVKPVLMIMSDPAYHGAASLAPLILLAYQFQTWADVVRFGIDVSERTKYASYAVWITVFVALGLYLVLIPRFGALGAAMTAVVAFWLRFQLTFFWAQRLFPIRYDWGFHVRLLAGATALTIGYLLIPVDGLLPTIGLATAIVAAYFAVTWFGVMYPEDRQQVLTIARGLPARFKRTRTA